MIVLIVQFVRTALQLCGRQNSASQTTTARVVPTTQPKGNYTLLATSPVKSVIYHSGRLISWLIVPRAADCIDFGAAVLATPVFSSSQFEPPTLRPNTGARTSGTACLANCLAGRLAS